MNGPVNFGIVGCGQISQKHADIIARRLPGARLVGVCDMNPERRAQMAAKYAVPAFASLEHMAATLGRQLHAVNVLTPSGYHADNVLEAVALGCKNIVVEKPMALTLEDAEEMIEACQRAGARLFVVAQNRCNRPVQALAQTLRAGRFGRLVEGTVRLRWCRKQSYYDASTWRGTWQLDGGVFANQAYHHIDLLTWLLGDVESVFAYTATQLADIEAEDTGTAVLRFRNGTLGIIEATTATRPRDLEGSISVLGEHGTVEIGGFSANKLKVWDFDPACAADEAVRHEQAENPANDPAYAHVAYLEEVVQCIRQNLPAMTDGRQGLKCLRLIHALYQSALTRSEIKLSSFRSSLSQLGKRPEKRPRTALAG